MDVSYSDGSTERIYGDDDADMAKKLEHVMGNPQFQSATIHKIPIVLDRFGGETRASWVGWVC